MKRLNGLSLTDSNGTYTVNDKCGNLFTGNYNHCIYVINHMGMRDNYGIPYIITDEQVNMFKDRDYSIQKQVALYIKDNYPQVREAYCIFCHNAGDAVMSLYRYTEKYHNDIFIAAFDSVPYSKSSALEQLSKNIDEYFAERGREAIAVKSERDLEFEKYFID